MLLTPYFTREPMADLELLRTSSGGPRQDWKAPDIPQYRWPFRGRSRHNKSLAREVNSTDTGPPYNPVVGPIPAKECCKTPHCS